MKIRLLVADDHALVRRALVAQLDEIPDIEVVGEAEDGQTAVEIAINTQPDVVLMDMSMPHCNGIDATRALAQEVPQARVVALSMYKGDSMASLMRTAGAAAFVCKEDSFDDLVRVIREVAAGHLGNDTVGGKT